MNRKAAKDGKPVPIPNLGNRRTARTAVRGGPSQGDTTYGIGPLTEEQIASGMKALSLNSHVRGQNIPGSKLVETEIAAPDLFDWLQSVIKGREVIDDLIVDDNVWKITYTITRNVDPPEMDEELREFLQEDEEETYEQSTITTEVSAEIMKIDGEEEGKNVIEFRRKAGDTQLYNDHVRWIVDHMQQDREEDQQAAASQQ